MPDKVIIKIRLTFSFVIVYKFSTNNVPSCCLHLRQTALATLPFVHHQAPETKRDSNPSDAPNFEILTVRLLEIYISAEV